MALIKCVLGAPCSGKSTFVKENFREGDIVWDYDEIKRAVILADAHAQGTNEQNQMIMQMRYTFAKHAAEIECGSAWFISTTLSDSIRDAFGDDFEIIEMDATEEECYERLEKDASRKDKAHMRELIYNYFHGKKEGRQMPVMTNEREYRDFKLTIQQAEEAQEEAMVVRGYASTFNEPYTLFEFEGERYMEQVDPAAFDSADMSDVIFQYNHEGRVFARQSNGTLRVSTDEHGLSIEADLGGTEIGRGLYEEIKGGYTDKMSFGFRVNADKWEERMAENGDTIHLRTITEIGKVYDVSAVSIPANDATSISVRNLSDGVIAKIQAERLEALELEKRKLLLKIKLLNGGKDNGKDDT